MNFWKSVLSTILGFFIALGILFFFFFIFIGVVSAFGDDGTVTVENNSILELNLDRPIKDYSRPVTPFEEAFGAQPTLGLNNILNAIQYAATDDKIKGISIKNNFSMAGMAQMKAIRNELKKFKESGKFIYTYADIYLQRDYYLNSVADSIFLNPVGELDFKGLASEVMYFKDFQEKSGIKMEVIRHGKYKSAVEPYLEDTMSEANREQISVLLQSVWDDMLADISDSRNLSVEELNRIADTLGGRNPELALAHRLIDKIAYRDEYERALKNAAETAMDEDLERVSVRDYASYAGPKTKGDIDADKIAIIYAQGTIMYGNGDENTIGQGIMLDALKEAREDEEIKAIVLRVNSPGGSALASEIIWRAIELTKETKPVIVSMGNLAASGGYYIACNADQIIAEPTTITGSIGVFGTLPNFSGLAEKIGLNAEQVSTNKQSVGYTPFEPLSEDFRGVVQEGIEEVYTTFLQRVAEGRNMDVAAVDSIAQGRVWTGADALKIGLVDEIGGLDLAIQRAAEAAEMDSYRISNYPKFDKDFDDLFKNFGKFPFGKAKEDLIREEIGDEAYEILQRIKTMSQQKGVQAMLPFEMHIK